MAPLPQLVEDDIQQLDQVLESLLDQTDASVAMVVDKGGFLITQAGQTRAFDLTTIAALAAGAFLASQTMACLVQETQFTSIYQQGERHSILVLGVNAQCLLIVIFKAGVGVGVVKYFAATAMERIAEQMKIALNRDPNAGIDLSALNVADSYNLFRKKTP